MTHDYTYKGGIVHTEIMLPAHALPELEAVGLVKRRWVSRCPTQPYHTYIKLPAGEDAP